MKFRFSNIVILSFMIFTIFLSAFSAVLKPNSPAGIKMEYSGNSEGPYKGILSWSPVINCTDGTPVGDNLEGYYIFRASNDNNDWELVGISSGNAGRSLNQEFNSSSFIFNPFFYRIYAVRKGWSAYFDEYWSAPSMMLDTSPDRNIIAVDSTRNASILVPKEISKALYAENNLYGEDLEILFAPHENNDFNIRILKSSTREDVTGDFSFPLALAEINVETPRLHSRGLSPNYEGDKPALYWFNGIEWVRIGGVSNGEFISANMARLGLFKVSYSAGEDTSFRINSIYPKIFTPSGQAPYNEVQFIFEKKWENIISGKVFDISGARIGALAKGVTEDSLSWNGKTIDGKNAPAGIYIYRIWEEGGQNITGTIILAR